MNPYHTIARYSILKTGNIKKFDIMVNEKDNVTFSYQNDIYEFCTLNTPGKINDGYKAGKELTTPWHGLSLPMRMRSLYLPYYVTFVNKEYNKACGLDENTELVARYDVYGIIETLDADDLKIARDYAGRIYTSLFNRLKRAYTRAPYVIRRTYETKQSLWETIKRIFGMGSAPKINHIYSLDMDKINFSRIVKNADIAVKHEMEPFELDRLNQIGMLLVISTNTDMTPNHINTFNDGTIARMYRRKDIMNV